MKQKEKKKAGLRTLPTNWGPKRGRAYLLKMRGTCAETIWNRRRRRPSQELLPYQVIWSYARARVFKARRLRGYYWSRRKRNKARLRTKTSLNTCVVKSEHALCQWKGTAQCAVINVLYRIRNKYSQELYKVINLAAAFLFFSKVKKSTKEK
jgi:hypothetical protein